MPLALPVFSSRSSAAVSSPRWAAVKLFCSAAVLNSKACDMSEWPLVTNCLAACSPASPYGCCVVLYDGGGGGGAGEGADDCAKKGFGGASAVL